MSRITAMLAALAFAPGAVTAQEPASPEAGEFVATPLGAGTYEGSQGPVSMTVPEGDKREIVLVHGAMPVGSNVGFHFHPGHALVAVTSGRVASLDSADCEPSAVYEAGEAFFDFPGHIHDIVNVGDEPAEFVVAFLLEQGAEPLTMVEDPGPENCGH